MSEDDQKPPLDAALRHLAEQQRRSLTSHPTPQELAAYHAGELPPEAEVKILDHLAICRECSDLLLDLSGFADLKPPEGVPELTDAQVEEDWQALRARMSAPERKPAEVVPFPPTGMPRQERRYSQLLPIAASLLATVLAFLLGFYMGAPRLQPSVPQEIYLETTRGEEGGVAQSISHQRDAVVFVRTLGDLPSYRLEIRLGDNVLWSGTAKGPATSVPIDIPGHSLEPGSYKIRLYGSEDSQDAIDYDLEVE